MKGDGETTETMMRDYSLLGEDGRLAVERGLAATEWYKTPIERKRMKQLMQRRDGPAIRDTVLWLGLMVLFGWLGVRYWFSLWSVLAFAAYGVLYGSASDSRWHECGHGTAFRTRWMNTAVYNIACFMIMRDPTVWRWSHVRHHTDTIIVGRDPEILATRPPAVGHILINFFGLVDVPRAMRDMVVHAAGQVSPQETTFIPKTEHGTVIVTARVWVVIYGAVLGACLGLHSILPAMLIGLPRLFGAWHHVLTGIAQHTGLAEDVADHRLNSRTVYLNPISRFVYWNMNYHIEHHMYPMVPFHALAALHAEIKDDLPEPATSIVAAYREIVPALKRQVHEPEFFVDRTPALAQRV
jgi:fatty acid desaturase